MNKEIESIIQDLKAHIELMYGDKKIEWTNKIITLEQYIKTNETIRK